MFKAVTAGSLKYLDFGWDLQAGHFRLQVTKTQLKLVMIKGNYWLMYLEVQRNMGCRYCWTWVFYKVVRILSHSPSLRHFPEAGSLKLTNYQLRWEDTSLLYNASRIYGGLADWA